MVVVVVVELGESALQHLPVERANLHRPGVVVSVVVLVHQGAAVLDLMGKRGATNRDTVVRTIRQNLSPCSCFHPVRSASEVAERALQHLPVMVKLGESDLPHLLCNITPS